MPNNTMKIYLIGHDQFVIDGYSHFVMVANDKTEVRKMAKMMASGEGKAIWDTANITEEGIYTGNQTEPFCLLVSYHAR